MDMEPITALGLAANIVQFIEFGIGIVSKSSELCNATDGRLGEHADISAVNRDLAKLTARLVESIAPHATFTVLSEDDGALLALCHSCLDISNELQHALDKLQVAGGPTRWKSMRKALKSVWRKEKIAALRQRLVDYRSEINARILVGLRSRVDVLELRQSEGFRRLDQSAKILIDTLLQSSTAVELMIEQQSAIIHTNVTSAAQSTQDRVVEVIDVASRQSQQGFIGVQSQLAQLRDLDAEANLKAQEGHDTALNAIAKSDENGRRQLEDTTAELTRQWQSAEQQIAQLRAEIMQLEVRLSAAVREAVANGGKPQDKKQKKLNEETNLLYKIWVAKDVMLQKLMVRQSSSPGSRLLTLLNGGVGTGRPTEKAII